MEIPTKCRSALLQMSLIMTSESERSMPRVRSESLAASCLYRGRISLARNSLASGPGYQSA